MLLNGHLSLVSGDVDTQVLMRAGNRKINLVRMTVREGYARLKLRLIDFDNLVVQGVGEEDLRILVKRPRLLGLGLLEGAVSLGRAGWLDAR